MAEKEKKNQGQAKEEEKKEQQKATQQNQKVSPAKGSESDDDIEIVDDVIAVIAGITANKVEGVRSMAGGSFVGNIREAIGRKDLAKGVNVETSEDNEVYVDISVIVQYGMKIHEVAKKVQQDVRSAIKSMTGLEVPSVVVNVHNVELEEESQESSEGEAKE